MSANSGTSVLAWEKGKRSPSMDQLDQLARIYGVPLSTFTEPRPTDEEWLLSLAAGALEAEAEDWASQERGSDPAAGGDADELPGTRTA
jgi:transcriptional regulator with XRE-family HTH domain